MTSSGSSGSSGAGIRICGENCAWRFDHLFGSWIVVEGCLDPDKWCDRPGTLVAEGQIANRPTCMTCYSPETLQRLARTTYAQKVPVRRFGIIVPDVRDARRIGRFTDVVNEDGIGQIVSAYGWLVKVRHKTTAGEDTHVTPDNLPAQDSHPGDNALAVGVALQDAQSGELQTFWVNISESHPWAVLSTPEWEVLVVRLPH